MKPNNNRLKAVVLCLVLLFAMGSIFYTPKLINASKPFIDLDGSVGTAIGNAESAFLEEANRPTPAPMKPILTPTPRPTPVPKPGDDAITIHVAADIVNMNNTRYDDFDAFTTALSSIDKAVRLVDDYAELKTFRKVMRALDRAGLSYTVTTEN